MGIHYSVEWDEEFKALPFRQISGHARQRMRQRGIKKAQIDLVLRYGTPVDGGAFMLRKSDAEREIVARKGEIAALERLRDCKVVIADGVLVTAYRPVGRRRKLVHRRERENH